MLISGRLAVRETLGVAPAGGQNALLLVGSQSLNLPRALRAAVAARRRAPTGADNAGCGAAASPASSWAANLASPTSRDRPNRLAISFDEAEYRGCTLSPSEFLTVGFGEASAEISARKRRLSRK